MKWYVVYKVYRGFNNFNNFNNLNNKILHKKQFFVTLYNLQSSIKWFKDI